MLVDSNLQGPVRVTLTWVLIYNVPKEREQKLEKKFPKGKQFSEPPILHSTCSSFAN